MKQTTILKTMAMAILIALVSCGGDEEPQVKPTPTPKKSYANITNAIVTSKPPLQKVYKANEKINISLKTNAKDGFGNIELDIYIGGKLYKNNYKTDTDNNKYINFSINPLDLGKAGKDVKNITYKITDNKTTKKFKQTRIHNNIMETVTKNEEF